MIIQKFLDNCFRAMPKRNGFNTAPKNKIEQILTIIKKKHGKKIS